MKLYISIKPQDYSRFMGALSRLRTQTPIIADHMCRYGAFEYKTEVLQAIAMQNFVTRIPRLKKKYLEWKIEHGYPRGIGILEHDLLNNITVFPMQGGWFGGVNPNARDAGNKNWSLTGPSNLVVRYATWLEEGNRDGRPDRQRPRPIFMPIAKRYVRDRYPLQVEKAARRIDSTWR